MTKRSKRVALTITVVLCALCATARSDLRPPNVVVLFIDDMGYADPSCCGNPMMQTPNIDRLAEEGIDMYQAL